MKSFISPYHREVIASLSDEEITRAIDSEGDYIVIEVFTFNAGWIAEIESYVNYPGEDKQIVLYKDHFEEMIEELESVNKAS